MSKKVLVIGGGIIGLNTAYFLQRKGHQVTVVDKGEINGGASFVNAGYVTPSHIIPLASPGMINQGLKDMFDSSSPFYMKPQFNKDFLQWAWNFKKSSTQTNVNKAIPYLKDINLISRYLYEAFKESKEFGAFQFERFGLLMIYQTQKMGDKESSVGEMAVKLGLEVNFLNSKQLSSLEPNIRLNALGAVHYQCDAHSTPQEFMKSMLNYLPTKGVEIKRNTEIIDFKLKGNTIEKAITKDEEIEIDEVVLAAGAWSPKLSKKLNIPISLEAGKGYCINVKEETGIQMPAILMERKMAVTPMNGFTRFAGTMEFSGINNKIRKNRVQAIVDGAKHYYKGLEISQKSIDEAQFGLRPVSADGLPFIGRTEKMKNLLIATGHAMMGYSLGPATGLLIAQIISDEKTEMNIAPFSPDRTF